MSKNKNKIIPFFVKKKINVSLYHGNSIEILKTFKKESIDMIFADPPYFLSNDGVTCQSGKMVKVNKGNWDKGMSIEKIHSFNKSWLTECRRVLKSNGTIYGLNSKTTRDEICLSVFETIGFQIKSALDALKKHSHIKIKRINIFQRL